jgi:hypothetical protein
MARWMKLRVRPGTGLHGPGVHFRAGDEFIVSYADAATFLKAKGRRSFEIVEDFETDSDEPPDGTISIGRLEEEPG